MEAFLFRGFFLFLGLYFPPLMRKLWAKRVGERNATRVSIEEGAYFYDFIKAAKNILQIPNPPHEISVSLTEGGKALPVDLKIELYSSKNEYEKPFFISVDC